MYVIRPWPWTLTFSHQNLERYYSFPQCITAVRFCENPVNILSRYCVNNVLGRSRRTSHACTETRTHTRKPDHQWRSSSFEESKKVRVSRDLWPWPWPWEHAGCRFTRRPSCVSLVAIWTFACEKKGFACQHKSARTTWPLTLTLTLTLSTPSMEAYVQTIVCNFGRDPAICLGEEAICAKVYRRTDRQTDNGRRAIALAHSGNELKKLRDRPTTWSGSIN